MSTNALVVVGAGMVSVIGRPVLLTSSDVGDVGHGQSASSAVQLAETAAGLRRLVET